MANELKHGSPGTVLTQAEYESITAHTLDSQATGDIIYAASSSQLRRLGVGSTNDVLRITGGVPDWQATTFITEVGTIATGVWQGTDVGVAYGGTGVSTLTDGGILLGSGASAITAMAVLTDGQMIVGNGSTDPVAESGATLRTSIGVGTGDSVQFAGITGTTGIFSTSVDITGSAGLILENDETITNSVDGAVRMSGKIVTGAGGSVSACAYQIGDDVNTGLINPVTDYLGLVGGGVEALRIGATNTFYTDVVIGGTTPTLTIGDAGTEDTAIVFDGNAQDYYIGLDDTADDLVIGLGSALGTTTAMSIDSDLHFAIGAATSTGNVFNIQKTDTAAARSLVVQGALTLPSGGGNGEQIRASGTIATPAESTVYTTISTVRIHEPTITLGSGSSLTNSASLYVTGTASEATNDYALWVDAGVSRLDGDLHLGIAGGTYTKLTSAGAITGSGTNISLSRTGSGAITVSDDISLVPHGGSAVLIGDGVAEDTELRFDGNAVDYHIGLDDSADDLVIGTASTLGSNIIMAFDSTEGRASLGNNGNADGQLTPAANVGLKARWNFGETGSGTHYAASVYGYATMESAASTGTIGGMQLGAGVASGSDENWTQSTTPGVVGLYTYLFTESSSSGVVTNAMDIYVSAGNESGATYTNKYGIYIADQTLGTNDYGLYIAGADTYAIWVDADDCRFDGNVFAGNAGTTSGFASGATQLVVGSGVGSQGMTIFAQDNNYSNITFNEPSDPDAWAGYIQYGHGTAGDKMIFGVAAASYMELSANQLNLKNSTLIDVGNAGNDWTANVLGLQNENSGGKNQIILRNNSDDANSSAELQIGIDGEVTSSDAFINIFRTYSTNIYWSLGLDNSNSQAFVISNNNGLGTNDALRITNATPPVTTYNTTHPTGTFDYVCESCGRHEAEQFECCGKVEWHDDVIDYRGMALRNPDAIDYMEKIGVIERTTDNDGKPEVFTVLGRDFEFAMSAAFQNRQRMDAQYDEMKGIISRLEKELEEVRNG